MQGADYGKLAYMKMEELSRRVNFLEREFAKLTAGVSTVKNLSIVGNVLNTPDVSGDT